MTVHNEIKYATQLLGAYARVLGIGDEEGVVRLGETLTPTFDLWTLFEAQILRGQVPWGGSSVQPLTAGELAFVGVSNPAAGRRLVVVTSLSFRTATAGETVHFGTSSEATLVANQDASANAQARDRRRIGTSGASAVIVRRGAAAATLITGIYARARTRTANEFTSLNDALPVLLRPGDAVIVEHQTVNVALELNFTGYERLALPGELDP